MSVPTRDAKGRFVKRGLSEEGKKHLAKLTEVTERFAREVAAGNCPPPENVGRYRVSAKRRTAHKCCPAWQGWWRRVLGWFGR